MQVGPQIFQTNELWQIPGIGRLEFPGVLTQFRRYEWKLKFFVEFLFAGAKDMFCLVVQQGAVGAQRPQGVFVEAVPQAQGPFPQAQVMRLAAGKVGKRRSHPRGRQNPQVHLQAAVQLH